MAISKETSDDIIRRCRVLNDRMDEMKKRSAARRRNERLSIDCDKVRERMNALFRRPEDDDEPDDGSFDYDGTYYSPLSGIYGHLSEDY